MKHTTTAESHRARTGWISITWTRAALGLTFLPLLLTAMIVVAMMVGPVTISPGETIHIILHRLGLGLGPVTWTAGDDSIIWQLRMPRVLAAALVGGALGVAGALFQAVLRNPLADPYVIGTSAGAQLGVALAFLLPIQFNLLGFGPIQILAFSGALVTIAFVYSIARNRGQTPVVTLLLAGFVVSSFLVSATSFVMISSNRMTQVLIWTMGSMDVSGTTQAALSVPIVLLAIGGAFILAPHLDVLLLGEEQAHHLGIRVEAVKAVAVVLASLLTAIAVTLAGVVAFVGLVVPHTARLLYGPRHRVLVPTAALTGSIFVVTADAIAHTVLAPTVLPLGVVTAVIGAPFFLHLLRRSRRDYAV